MSENPGGDTSESGFVRDLPKRSLFRPLHWLAAIVIVAILYYAVLVVPAGTIGVYDLFGKVSDQVVAPGIHIVNPLAKIHNMSVRTQDLKETKERGIRVEKTLMVSCERSLNGPLGLFRLSSSPLFSMPFTTQDSSLNTANCCLWDSCMPRFTAWETALS